MSHFTDNSLKSGTVSGTLLVLLVNIQGEDIIKTGILSMTGALVSFIVSFILKKIVRRQGRPPKH